MVFGIIISLDFASSETESDIFRRHKTISKMFKLFVIASLVVAAFADHIDKNAHIIEQKSEVNYDGTYTNTFQTSNGIGYSETGLGGVASNGISQYYDPSGQLHEISWTADENGYRPTGKDIPTPPPIPSYIIRALEYIRTHPPKDQPQRTIRF